MNYEQLNQPSSPSTYSTKFFIFIRNKTLHFNIIANRNNHINSMIMRYFLCFLCPPIAILTTGRMGSFVLNIILTLLFWIPGIIHSILVVNDFYEDRRFRRYARATRRGF